MVLTFLRRCDAAIAPTLLAAAMTAHAQPLPPTAPRPDPLDPKAGVPALRYESVLAQPPSSGSSAPVGWREANDAVARIGGWRAYAREAQQAAVPRPSPPPAPASGAAPSMPGGEGQHGRHGGHEGGRKP
jgi:hypothetical protein